MGARGILMDCSKCEKWNKGRGQKECTTSCKQYRDFQRNSVKRESIRTEHIPQAILENIADPRTRTLLNLIQQLPPIYSVPLMMRSLLNMSYEEIALYHHVSRSPMQRRISHAIVILKKSLLDG
jgi:DNA-directed RNA polymerase specialized sigma24 family protein